MVLVELAHSQRNHSTVTAPTMQRGTLSSGTVSVAWTTQRRDAAVKALAEEMMSTLPYPTIAHDSVAERVSRSGWVSGPT